MINDYLNQLEFLAQLEKVESQLKTLTNSPHFKALIAKGFSPDLTLGDAMQAVRETKSAYTEEMSGDLDNLKNLIAQARIDACQKIAEVVIAHIKQSGFTTADFLDGIAGLLYQQGFDRPVYFLGEAAMALYREIKSKNNEEIAPPAANQ